MESSLQDVLVTCLMSDATTSTESSRIIFILPNNLSTLYEAKIKHKETKTKNPKSCGPKSEYLLIFPMIGQSLKMDNLLQPELCSYS